MNWMLLSFWIICYIIDVISYALTVHRIKKYHFDLYEKLDSPYLFSASFSHLRHMQIFLFRDIFKYKNDDILLVLFGRFTAVNRCIYIMLFITVLINL